MPKDIERQNRTSWGPGPWDFEPDVVRFVEHGLKCEMHRNLMGAWCGYVGVPKEHPAWAGSYWDEPVASLRVHGGVTYCDDGNGYVGELRDGLWWIGFDCGHSGDYIPSMLDMHHEVAKKSGVPIWKAPLGQYRDLDYVAGEVKELAKQLQEIANMKS